MKNFLHDTFHNEPHETVGGIVIAGFIAVGAFILLTPLRGDYDVSLRYDEPTPAPRLAQVLSAQQVADEPIVTDLAINWSPDSDFSDPKASPAPQPNQHNFLSSIFSLLENFFK